MTSKHGPFLKVKMKIKEKGVTILSRLKPFVIIFFLMIKSNFLPWLQYGSTLSHFKREKKKKKNLFLRTEPSVGWIFFVLSSPSLLLYGSALPDSLWKNEAAPTVLNSLLICPVVSVFGML